MGFGEEHPLGRGARLLRNAIDLHIHTAPAPFPRPWDEADVAQMALDAGMRAIVVKDHHQSTSSRAYYARKIVPGIEVIGGVALNHYEGSLNPYFVDAELTYGARFVWMPTIGSQNHIAKFGKPGFPGFDDPLKLPVEGISIIDSDGKLVPEVYQILELIAGADAVLATGHIDERESEALVPEAFRVGVKRVVITHVNSPVSLPSMEAQKRWADMGAWIEYTYLPATALWYTSSPREIAEAIREIGSERVVLSTDLATFYTANPVEGFRIFLECLLTVGVPEAEIKQMAQDNPAKVLGI